METIAEEEWKRVGWGKLPHSAERTDSEGCASAEQQYGKYDLEFGYVRY